MERRQLFKIIETKGALGGGSTLSLIRRRGVHITIAPLKTAIPSMAMRMAILEGGVLRGGATATGELLYSYARKGRRKLT